MATTIRAQTISASRIKARAARMSSPALLGTSMGQASSFAGTRLRTTTSIATRRLSVYANVSARSEGLVGRLGRVVRSSWTQFILNQEDPERWVEAGGRIHQRSQAARLLNLNAKSVRLTCAPLQDDRHRRGGHDE
mmetsp:Transcript_6598/g.22721  ORF Transcript_6598/g.22721 Transcript_6598/m.22721 type:complete len:136 (+) Transcript_6598:1868-2275(+)